MTDSKKLVEIGKIVAPHGVRGEVRVMPLSEFDEAVDSADSFHVQGRGQMEVEGLRYHKKFILLTFAGVVSMDEAERLRGKLVYLSREQIGALPEGRYYIEDLLGLDVFDTEGALLGQLCEVLTTGSNDVYVIKKEGVKDLLLPALKNTIIQTDLEHRKMIVDPPVWED